jgi:hypothetical protein
VKNRHVREPALGRRPTQHLRSVEASGPAGSYPMAPQLFCRFPLDCLRMWDQRQPQAQRSREALPPGQGHRRPRPSTPALGHWLCAPWPGFRRPGAGSTVFAVSPIEPTMAQCVIPSSCTPTGRGANDRFWSHSELCNRRASTAGSSRHRTRWPAVGAAQTGQHETLAHARRCLRHCGSGKTASMATSFRSHHRRVTYADVSLLRDLLRVSGEAFGEVDTFQRSKR